MYGKTRDLAHVFLHAVLLRYKNPYTIFDHESSCGQKNLYYIFNGQKVYYLELLHNFIMYGAISSCLHLETFWYLMTHNFVMFVYFQKRFGNYVMIFVYIQKRFGNL